MTTKNLVPRADGEGQIGTSAKKWSQANFQTGSFDTLSVSGQSVSGDSISEGDSSVEVTDTGSNGNITFKTESTNRWQITSAGHLVPQANNAFDIGSSTNPIRDLYISNNSIHFSNADNTATPYVLSIDTSNNKLRFSSDNGSNFEEIVRKDSSGSLDVSVTATPTNDTDVVNKAYVDSVVQGLDVKKSVAVATTASFTMASTASTNTLVLADGEGGFNATADTLTIDGVSVAASSRVLIKDGVNSNSSGISNKWNGVYTVGALNGTTCTLTRSEDFNDPQEFTGAPFFMVESGSINGAHGFVCNVTSNPSIGTDPITFYKFSAPGQDAVAGAGLSMSGNVLSIDINELDSLNGVGLHQTQDHFLFSDNGIEKKITFSNLQDAVFNSVSGDAVIAAGGALTIQPNSVQDSMINNDVATGLAGAGLSATSGVMAIDLDELTTATVDVANDSIAIIDASASNGSRKESIADLVAAIAGSNLTATNGVLSASGGGGGETITVASNSGLAKNSGALSLDLDNLSSLDEASIGEFGDSIPIYDNSANTAKKINIKDFLYSAFESATEDNDPTWDVNTTICFVDRGIQNGTSNARINRMSIRNLLDHMFEGPSYFPNSTPAADDHFLIYDNSYWGSGKVRELEWNSLLFWAAGDGLVRNQSSRNIEVNVDDTTIEISSDTVQIKDSGVTSAKLASNSVTHASLASSSINSQSEKSSVHDNDELLIVDSEDSNNLKKVKKSTLVSGSGGSYSSSIKDNAATTGWYTPGTPGTPQTINDNGTNNEVYYILTPTANNAIELPTPSTSGQKINIKNMSSSYTIVISAGTNKLDGSTSNTHSISNQYENITFVADGNTNWYRV